MSTIDSNTLLKNSHLGKATDYIAEYNPDLLFPIPRAPKRAEINISNPLPFSGFDVWNAYELSWLNQKGKPQVAMGEIILPCDTPNIIESKSMKLYFNSFNNTKISDIKTVTNTIQNDLSAAAGKQVEVNLTFISQQHDIRTETFSGDCLDKLDVSIKDYQVNPALLFAEDELTEETLYSNLYKSNCLATGQPDWASIQIHYQGKKLNREGLLKYLTSYRNHSEFHEQCIERVFTDILQRCQPSALTVEARYTRRGGIDINPSRSTNKNIRAHNRRQIRQ